VLPLVIRDLQVRADAGESKYGTRLRVWNGRDALIDHYQELLDAAMYVRQLIEEEKNTETLPELVTDQEIRSITEAISQTAPNRVVMMSADLVGRLSEELQILRVATRRSLVE
jgi:hypothetical protein